METITIKGIVDGTEKELSFPIAPTPLAKLLRAKELFEKGVATEGGAEALAEAIFYGIRRAKGDITLEWLVDNIDSLNQDAIFAKFIEVNGLVPKGKSSGEAEAGAAS